MGSLGANWAISLIRSHIFQIEPKREMNEWYPMNYWRGKSDFFGLELHSQCVPFPNFFRWFSFYFIRFFEKWQIIISKFFLLWTVSCIGSKIFRVKQTEYEMKKNLHCAEIMGNGAGSKDPTKTLLHSHKNNSRRINGASLAQGSASSESGLCSCLCFYFLQYIKT